MHRPALCDGSAHQLRAPSLETEQGRPKVMGIIGLLVVLILIILLLRLL